VVLYQQPVRSGIACQVGSFLGHLRMSFFSSTHMLLLSWTCQITSGFRLELAAYMGKFQCKFAACTINACRNIIARDAGICLSEWGRGCIHVSFATFEDNIHISRSGPPLSLIVHRQMPAVIHRRIHIEAFIRHIMAFSRQCGCLQSVMSLWRCLEL